MTTVVTMNELSTDAKLKDLDLIDFQVTEETPCENVVRRLEDDNKLCGVVVLRDGELLGMLTRRAILEWMLSRPYGLDVFLKRPISSMIEYHQRDFILLPGESNVVDASTLAFQRPEETIYDPVVVEYAPNDYRLLDLPILLVAQAQVHLATKRKIEEQQDNMKQVMVVLEKERVRSQRYAQDLERQQSEILAQNLALEVERQAAQARSEELAMLNSRILDISTLLSQKGRSTFAATFEGVEAVRSLAEEISRSSQDLQTELREINTIADLIVEVAGYIRLLSFNAAVEANRSGSSVGGFGAIAQEIRKLAGRTTEASSRIRGLADRIQRKSSSTVTAAQSSTQVVQSLSEQAQSAQEALDQLQSLLDSAQTEF
ncbi:MAG: methyl-accepting chemotaxis protein [Cyanobacteriota bacterium]|nr:methyl-accepting chemotaxis protein [Cyanobacteriota bacterium]